MRTTLLFDALVIAAQCRIEDHLRAAAEAQTIAAAGRPTQRHRSYTVRAGRALIQIGERLQALAQQPA